MKEQTVNITNLRSKPRQILSRARSGKSVIVQVLGEPIAAIMGMDEYRDLMELKRTRAARRRRFGAIRQAARRNAMPASEALSLALEAQSAPSR